MFSKIKILAALLSLVLLSSCELLENTDNLNVAERLKGEWQCDEKSSIYKSTLDIYQVNITIREISSDQILIYGFYGLGSTKNIIVDIEGDKRLIIKEQNTDGFIFRGTGIIASDFNKIEWNYEVNDGSGVWDKVNATYTKIKK